MEDEEGIEKRIGQLERKLDEALKRLDELDSRTAQRSVPPPIPASIMPPISHQLPSAAPPQVRDQPPTRPSVATGDEMEYRFGAQVLPRVGAAVILLGLAYLVGLGIQRGWITPLVQFWGAIAISAAFVRAGIRKLEEHEGYGQTLVGIGSYGLYISFAAGHAYHRLYEAEALVTLFVALSLANLGFSFWRSSRTFLAIGLLGGLVGALMPLQRDNLTLNFVLHMAIVVPAAAIVVHNRWSGAAIGLWVVTTFALAPAIVGDFAWTTRIAFLYANAVLCTVAYALAYEHSEFDPKAVFCAVPPILAPVAGYLIRDGLLGSAHVAVLGVVTVFIGLALRHPKTRATTLAGGILAVFVFAPFGFVPVAATMGFLGATVLCCVASFRWPAPGAALAWIELSLASFTVFANVVEGRIGWETECGLLVALILLVSACVFVSERAWPRNGLSLHVGMFLGIVAWTQLVRVAGPNVFGVSESEAVTGGWIVAGIGLLAAGFAWDARPVRLWSYLPFGLALSKALVYDIWGLDPLVRVVLLMALGLALVIGGYAYVRHRSRQEGSDD